MNRAMTVLCSSIRHVDWIGYAHLLMARPGADSTMSPQGALGRPSCASVGKLRLFPATSTEAD
jgi:hypothetical protein